MQYTNHPQYIYTKLGVYYFSKAVPCDLRPHYSKPRIVFSLKTKSVTQASRASKSMLAKLENYWNSLRLQRVDVPAAHLLLNAGSNKQSDLPTIGDALEIYFELKGSAKDKTFYSAGRRNVAYVVECLGCRTLDNYSSADGGKFRGWLIDKGLVGIGQCAALLIVASFTRKQKRPPKEPSAYISGYDVRLWFCDG